MFFFGQQRGFADKVLWFFKADKAFHATFKQGVIGGQITLPSAVAFFHTHGVQGVHAEGLGTRGADRIVGGFAIIKLGMHFPT